MTTQAEREQHHCLVAFADCGCLWGVVVLEHSHNADAHKSAAGWAKKGARIQQMTVAAFRSVPLRCPGHPDGRWDSRGRSRPLVNAGLGL